MHRRDPKRFLERVCWGDEADHIDTLLTDMSRVIFCWNSKAARGSDGEDLPLTPTDAGGSPE